jgi:hypothetical protein
MSVYYDQMLAKLPWFHYLTFQILVTGYVGIHILFALGVCFLTYCLPAKILDSYDQYLWSYSSSHLNLLPRTGESSWWQKLRAVGKDFISPLFLLSLLLSAIFFYATLHSIEAFFMAFFRLIGVAFFTFFVVRHFFSKWCIAVFSKLNFFKKYTPLVAEVLHRIASRP